MRLNAIEVKTYMGTCITNFFNVSLTVLYINLVYKYYLNIFSPTLASSDTAKGKIKKTNHCVGSCCWNSCWIWLVRKLMCCFWSWRSWAWYWNSWPWWWRSWVFLARMWLCLVRSWVWIPKVAESYWKDSWLRENWWRMYTRSRGSVKGLVGSRGKDGWLGKDVWWKLGGTVVVRESGEFRLKNLMGEKGELMGYG